MSRPAGVVDAQLRALLERVETYRDRHCAEILDEAHRRAHEIVGQAYDHARQRLHREVSTQRERFRSALRSAQARLQSATQHRRRQARRALLERCWERLRDELIRRWQRSETRGPWVEGVSRRALQMLPQRDWQVAYAPGWPEAERSAFARRTQGLVDHTPALGPDPALEAGLRICVDHACVDGTLDGLLWDRTHIEALLLAQIDRLRPRSEG
jgi:nucleotidyltransferase/DNA polymerase involved in DNA repair